MLIKFKKFFPIGIVLLLIGCQHAGKIIGTTGLGTAGYYLCKELTGRDDVAGVCAAGGAYLGYRLGEMFDNHMAKLEKVARQNNMDIKAQKVVTNNQKQAGNTDINAQIVSVNHKSMFLSGKSKLSLEAEKAFKNMARLYKGRQTKINIVGHTDSSGTDELNQRLSEQRALTVAKLFEYEGIEKNRIYYQGAGETQSVSSNASAAGRAANRRVEVIETDSEHSVVSLADQQKVNPNYLKVEKPQKTKDEVKIEKQKKKFIVKKEKKPIIPVLKTSRGGLYLGGIPITDKKTNLWLAIGEETSGFSDFFMKKAYAIIPQKGFNCLVDSPRKSGQVKKLSDRSVVKLKTREYRPGLYQTAWAEILNSHLVSLSPIGVLRDGGVVGTPKVNIYKKYKNSKQKSNYKTNTDVNIYEGDEGVLYRIFVKDKKNPISCIDIVFKNNDANRAHAGMIYYKYNKDLYSTEFKPKRNI